MAHPFLADPADILWRVALGYMPDFVDVEQGQAGWIRRSHRGVNRLDAILIPSRQLRYVNSKKFDFRINSDFAGCVQHCADTSRDTIRKRLGKTWLTPVLIDGLLRLHNTGHAFSFEAWTEDQLAGGVIGIQVGSAISLLSMFYLVPHASKVALGRGLFHLRDRGFEIADRGAPPDHSADYGTEWWPRWKYESAILRLTSQDRPLVEGGPSAALPANLKRRLPLVRATRAVWRRLGLPELDVHHDPTDDEEQAAPEEAAEVAVEARV